MSRRFWMAGLLSIVLVEASSAFALALASSPTARDDGYHYSRFRDGQHDWNYVEWWYLNVIDEASGLRLAFTYSVLDPDDLTGFGSAGVMAVAYVPGDSFHESLYDGRGGWRLAHLFTGPGFKELATRTSAQTSAIGDDSAR
jgi:hypothetical protein